MSVLGDGEGFAWVKTCQMGFCRNLCCFYLEGKETSGENKTIFAPWVTGEGTLGWSGDSRGVRGSVVWTCRIWKYVGSGVTAPRKELKTHVKQVSQADITTGWELKTDMAARTWEKPCKQGWTSLFRKMELGMCELYYFGFCLFCREALLSWERYY